METGSAGEQPVSNRFPALHCNKIGEDGQVLSSFYIVTGIALWLRKPILYFQIIINYKNNLLSVVQRLQFLVSIFIDKRRILPEADILQDFSFGHSIFISCFYSNQATLPV